MRFCGWVVVFLVFFKIMKKNKKIKALKEAGRVYKIYEGGKTKTTASSYLYEANYYYLLHLSHVTKNSAYKNNFDFYRNAF